MIWFFIAIIFAILAYYFHSSADKIENSSKGYSQPPVPVSKVKTYWESFKESNPTKANEIENIWELDFSTLSDRDIKEKKETLERLSIGMNCSISQIKENYLKEIEKYPARLIPQMIEYTSGELFKEMKTFHILEGNTASALMVKWLKERQQSAPSDKSYWETWKSENPEKANALEILTDRNFDDMSIMDIKQTIKAFGTVAETFSLKDWMDIKDYFVTSYANFSETVGEEDALRVISSILLEQNDKVNVSLCNSVYNYAKQWIKEYKENNADRDLNPEDKFRKEYRKKLMNKIGSNANIPFFCHGYDSPIAHEIMYIMYQHLRNGELKTEAEKQGLWNKYMQIIVDETEKVTKKYCHVFLQECIEYYNFPDKPVITRYRCPSCGSTHINDAYDYSIECMECGRTWSAPYGKKLYL